VLADAHRILGLVSLALRIHGWLQGLRVTADGTGIVSHAGVALIRVAQVAPDNRVVWFCAIRASACTDTTG
jgi:hypothetical protein